MVVEDACCSAQHGFLIAHDVPGKSGAWRPIVLVARKSLLDADSVLRGEHVCRRKSDAGKRIRETNRRNLLRNLVVITNAIVHVQMPTDSPGILSKESDRLIINPAHRVAVTLNKV